ncbi:hypothetical protein DPMN_173962 [Dreissena polymorpha]|uniref:Uncharacterized protein n=1 Tax=Dreissena polymorpha TaxID=45954 RepID=A0A9D4E3R7_DREPO|nr:hypothetical protein DPMN_173962 [Dreissena polymorpha]
MSAVLIYPLPVPRFGRLDAVIYNAGAITWQPVLETPLKRLDLMLDVNVRGAYVTVQESVPVMLQQKFGRLVLVAPPIYNRYNIDIII